ncbi:MFS transporter [Branchiibius sp. NY16-3462-2]|uniref:MFS transporter n=1 Tax=Branchiibius sp. NY16-3462-2 TaxID=1807500 RepID=UPI000796E98E|nr:MFS transporter [Branchiibius sp. NY16-3462-2]KYH46292.1 hypothetical protein AZH51_11825 [Branchiibius sp. NY16-3462-2]
MRWLEPWYSAYAITGLMVLGVAPILMPVTVDAAGHGATIVGLVVAAFYVGGLFAPLLGSLADRTGRQRAVFLATFPIMAVTVAGFAFTQQVWLWALLALVFGGAGSLCGTVAGLFVVEAHPQPEWNDRLSWFRLAYGAGQVVGLIIAAVAATHLKLGWLVTAALLAAGFLLGQIGLPHLKPSHPGKDATAGAPSTHRHVFPVFILTWLLTMTGVQTYFNVVPLIMRDAFGISASTTSLLFLVGAVVGTAIYPFCGKLANRVGPGLVLLIGLTITAASFAAMAIAHAADLPGKAAIGGAALVTSAIAYAFEVVAATMMIVRVTPGDQGSAMGLLNGIIAAGAVIGAVAPSFLAEKWGYPALPAVALAVLIVAAAVGIPLYRKKIWT